MKPKFQKRHYVTLASVVRDAKRKALHRELNTLHWLERDLANVFAADNPKFRRDTFERACTPTTREARS